MTRRSHRTLISLRRPYFALQYCLGAISLILFGGLARSQVQWLRENPDLAGAAYGNQTFVVVGKGDTVWTSPDSLEWSRHTTGFNADLAAVAFGNGTFVAVGVSEFNGFILRSTDGLAWSRQSVTELTTKSGDPNWSPLLKALTFPMTGVVFLNNQFVAIGGFVGVNLSIGIVLVSPDGISWKGAGVGPGLFGVAFGNNKYVAVGGRQLVGPPYSTYREVLESPDLASWQKTDDSLGAVPTDVAYGNGVFVAVSDDGVQILTTNGWQKSNGWQPMSSGAVPTGIAFGKGLFVVTGGESRLLGRTTEGFIVTSADGMSWTNQVSETIAPLRRVVFANNNFLAVGDGGTVLSSPDGLKWTVLQSNFGFAFSSLTYGNGLFVALGGRTLLTSTDGLSWRRSPGGASLAFPRQVAYGGGKFVAVGNIDVTQGGLITSSDGILWHQPLLSLHNELESVVFARGLFVVGGSNGVLMTSPDGETWTMRDTEVSTWRVITYGNDTFLALGSAGVVNVATSPDGLTWQSGNTTSQIAPVSLAVGKGLFVAIDQNPGFSRLLTSTNGVDWQQRYATGGPNSAGYALNSVGYADGTFVAVGDKIVTSSDGIHWTNRPAVFNDSLVALAFGNNYQVAVGQEGAIVISPIDESLRPFLSAPTVSTNGAFQFIISGNVGQSIDVQASSNLTDWLTIMTVPAASQPSLLLDTAVTNLSYRFYRGITPAP